MVELTHDEFDRQVQEAMLPPQTNRGNGFSPGIQKLRQTAQQRRPALLRSPRQQLPVTQAR